MKTRLPSSWATRPRDARSAVVRSDIPRSVRKAAGVYPGESLGGRSSGALLGNPPQFREHFWESETAKPRNAEEPLEVLGCGYDQGSKGWDEHSGEVFLINRRFVFEREAKQTGV